MDKHNFPVYEICNLNADKNENELFSVDRFRGYVDSNPHLQMMHNHNYYHLVFFTEGSGTHIIDFEQFPVKKGMIYFMRPGQVHQWKFENKYDGYVINFSANFFDWIGINSSVLQQFSFFKTMLLSEQVFTIQAQQSNDLISVFEDILKEYGLNDAYSNFKMATLTLQMCVMVQRLVNLEHVKRNDYQSVLINNFQNLIEQYYTEKKLPKQYAELLYITPNHLNALCKDVLGISSGELIRNRIILEAKRLLVNKELTINEITYLLNFKDSSYFVKFFKKYTNFTPDQFRKQFYI